MASVTLRPGALSPSSSRPLWMPATARARLSPSPKPGLERLPSSRPKRSSARSRWSAGMPGPRSATVKTISPPTRAAETETCAGALSVAPYFSALSVRFARAWPTSSRLPMALRSGSTRTSSRAPASSATAP